MFYRKISASFTTRLRSIAFAALTLAAPLAISQAAHAATQADAQQWVGHYASERLGAGGSSFFDAPGIAEKLPRLYGAETRPQLDSYERAGRVQQVAQYLIVSKCRASSCAEGSATLIVDTRSQDVWVVFKHQAADGNERCWTGTRQYAVLPAALQAAFNVD